MNAGTTRFSRRFSTGEIVNIILEVDRAGPTDRGQHLVALAGEDLEEFTLAAHQKFVTIASADQIRNQRTANKRIASI